MISRFFIDRPIFATVLSIVITLTGVIALLFLPIAQYPRITPPGISISISYPGANALEVADSIAAPIEQQVNGVEGMLYMSSNSGNDGSYSLTVTFDIGTDVNSALVMVQNRVTLALPQLPSAAQNQGITIRKRTPDMLMIVNFISKDGRYDDKYLSNFATIYCKDELLRVDGISDLNIFGQRDYSMRVWVDPQKLAGRNMTVIDVANTINNENIDAPAGRVGQSPSSNGLAFTYPIDTLARLTLEEQFGAMTVKVGGAAPILSQTGSPVPPGGSSATAISPTSSTSSGSSSGGNSMAAAANSMSSGAAASSSTSANGTYLTNPTSTGSASAVTNTLVSQDPPELTPSLTDISQFGVTALPSTSDAASGSTMTGGTVGNLSLGTGNSSGPQAPSSPLVKMRDVARLELGAQNYNTVCSFDGNPSVGFGLYQLPGTNALEVAGRVREKMEELKKGWPPGVEYSIAYDTSLFVRDSVDEVVQTLLLAILLVAIVVIVFLQSWRAALIPLIAVPVSVLGTFAVMAALGFSLNNISLFGLVLAIGIVVDDAIVVVENVERWLERGFSPREATYRAMDEVTGPIIAVALVLCAVFVPCAFMEGITGQFFRQFAVTIAVSTVISTINSLTFSPAMSAILLRPHSARPDWLTWVIHIALGWFFWLFNKTFGAITATYGWSVGRVIKLAPIILIGYAILLVLTVQQFLDSPKGFIPQQDQGRLIVNMQLPDAASLDRTYNTILQVEQTALQTPGVAHTITNAGMSFLLQANSPNFGAMFIVLKPFEIRQKGWFKFTDPELEAIKNAGVPDSVLEKLSTLKRKEFDWEALESKLDGVDSNGERLGSLLTAEESAQYKNAIVRHAKQPTPLSDVTIMAKLRRRWAKDIDAQVTVFPSAPIPGLGSAGGFKFVVEDRGGLGVRNLEGRMEDIVDKFRKLPYLADAKTQFRANIPQLYVDVDRIKATALGCSIDDINQTLIMYLGSLYVTSYNAFGRHWQVTIQAEGKFRNEVEQLKLYQVRNSSGQMVPLSTLVTLRSTGGPITVNRYNLYVAAPIQGNVLPGKSDGDAIDAINKVADDTLPRSMRVEWTELMFLQIRAGNKAIYIFMLSVISVFLALSALYESWGLPLAVILVVPLCLLCSVFGTVTVAGKDVNIFVQIGLVVLVGLACKNAILIVEFAKQLRLEGKSCYDATREASRLRLRPILMTSFAFIFGVMPLMYASGAGAEMRKSLGTAVFSGMLGVTAFGIFLTPVFFYIIQGLSESTIFQALPVRLVLSYGSGASLGAAIGYLLDLLDVGVPANWNPLLAPAIGAAAGVLAMRGVLGLQTRIRTRSGSPGRTPGRSSRWGLGRSEGEPKP